MDTFASFIFWIYKSIEVELLTVVSSYRFRAFHRGGMTPIPDGECVEGCGFPSGSCLVQHALDRSSRSGSWNEAILIGVPCALLRL